MVVLRPTHGIFKINGILKSKSELQNTCPTDPVLKFCQLAYRLTKIVS